MHKDTYISAAIKSASKNDVDRASEFYQHATNNSITKSDDWLDYLKNTKIQKLSIEEAVGISIIIKSLSIEDKIEILTHYIDCLSDIETITLPCKTIFKEFENELRVISANA